MGRGGRRRSQTCGERILELGHGLGEGALGLGAVPLKFYGTPSLLGSSVKFPALVLNHMGMNIMTKEIIILQHFILEKPISSAPQCLFAEEGKVCTSRLWE